jgi:predicted oxidoreductase (fatty acid repression mutant protein)
MELDELRKLQATVQDAAHAIEQTVNKEITSTESELNSIAQTAAQAVQPAAENPVIDAAAPPAAETPPTAPSVQAQLDLGAEQSPPARKQA